VRIHDGFTETEIFPLSDGSLQKPPGACIKLMLKVATPIREPDFGHWDRIPIRYEVANPEICFRDEMVFFMTG